MAVHCVVAGHEMDVIPLGSRRVALGVTGESGLKVTAAPPPPTPR